MSKMSLGLKFAELKKQLVSLHEDENGDVIQFFAIAALVLLALGAGWVVMGPKIKESWSKAGGELDKVNNSSY